MRFQKFVLPSTLVMLAASSVLVGCATPSSAPIVHRTTGTETSEAKREYYTVGRGDTLSGIGQRFGVSTRDIVEWNQLSANPVLQAGQVLRVAAPVVAAAPKPAAPTDVAQTAPIRPPMAVVSPVDSPKVAVKTGPKGIKRPYSDDTYAQMAKGETSATGVAAASPSVVVIPAPATVTPTAAATTVPPATDTRADASGLSWSWPAAGKVMQTFDRKTNKGFTISGEPGKPVIAAAKGKVIFAKDFPDYGKLVIVSHGPDLVSIYGYNNSISVKEGQQVERGQKVGEQGPRVQFEVRRSGQPIDPSQFLPQR
jgi:lipoprotein NlpD